MNFHITPARKRQLRKIAVQLELGRPVKGFRRFKSTYRQHMAFRNDKLGIVVKKPKYIGTNRTPRHLRVPTIQLGLGWRVQPIVAKVHLKLAYGIIIKQLEPYFLKGIIPDAHIQNVGWYEGKPLLFDW